MFQITLKCLLAFYRTAVLLFVIASFYILCLKKNYVHKLRSRIQDFDEYFKYYMCIKRKISIVKRMRRKCEDCLTNANDIRSNVLDFYDHANFMLMFS